ncbi:MAG: hypothetical protein IH798_03115 [Gemmatimonadetes bacterium]|nr:hypothetical protein [Gemmatimonadota bacterium]
MSPRFSIPSFSRIDGSDVPRGSLERSRYSRAGRFAAHAEGYDGSVALIAGLKAIADFEISAGAYP